MNIIVIGLGSMGKRRIRLTQQIDATIGIIGVDLNEVRRKETEEKLGIKTATSINIALEMQPDSDCAIVSTSPLSHANIINECLSKNLNVFTELNLVSSRYEENIELAYRKKLVLFMSSTFLYRDEMKYMRNRIISYKAEGKRLSYTYHIGQYLPDWHPWESYKDFFVADKRTNACREIMAIELPWLKDFFGHVCSVIARGGRLTNLDIDYPDNYHILIEHDDGTIGTLSVDIASRKAVRNLEIYGEELYFSWNGSPDSLVEFDLAKKQVRPVQLYDHIDHQDGYSAFVVENAYRNELAAFYEQVKDGTKPLYDFKDDLETLNLIDDIEVKVSANA